VGCGETTCAFAQAPVGQMIHDGDHCILENGELEASVSLPTP